MNIGVHIGNGGTDTLNIDHSTIDQLAVLDQIVSTQVRKNDMIGVASKTGGKETWMLPVIDVT